MRDRSVIRVRQRRWDITMLHNLVHTDGQSNGLYLEPGNQGHLLSLPGARVRINLIAGIAYVHDSNCTRTAQQNTRQTRQRHTNNIQYTLV
jgi:hypothetical protein